MPAVYLFGKRTLWGGDDLQLPALMTILVRILQLSLFVAPMSFWLWNQITFSSSSASSSSSSSSQDNDKNATSTSSIISTITNILSSILDHVLVDYSDSTNCLHSHFFPLLTSMYLMSTIIFSCCSIVLEYKLFYWTCQGRPTQTQPRTMHVENLLEWKLFVMAIFLGLLILTYCTAQVFVKKYKHCLFEQQQDQNDLYNNNYYQFLNYNYYDDDDDDTNNNNNNNNISHQDGNSIIVVVGSHKWWAVSSLLIASQAAELFLTVLFWIQFWKTPYAQPYNNNNNNNNNRNRHTQHIHHELSEELWADRCHSLCQCLSLSTCCLFGGHDLYHYQHQHRSGNTSNGNNNYYEHVARALADYLETGDTLDVVPTDILAGLFVLQRLQRQRILQARLCVRQQSLSNKAINNMNGNHNNTIVVATTTTTTMTPFSSPSPSPSSSTLLLRGKGRTNHHHHHSTSSNQPKTTTTSSFLLNDNNNNTNRNTGTNLLRSHSSDLTIPRPNNSNMTSSAPLKLRSRSTSTNDLAKSPALSPSPSQLSPLATIHNNTNNHHNSNTTPSPMNITHNQSANSLDLPETTRLVRDNYPYHGGLSSNSILATTASIPSLSSSSSFDNSNNNSNNNYNKNSNFNPTNTNTTAASTTTTTGAIPRRGLLSSTPSNKTSRSARRIIYRRRTAENDIPITNSNYYQAENRKVLNPLNPVDCQRLQEGAHMAKYALCIYTWMLYVYVHPLKGVAKLLYRSLLRRKCNAILRLIASIETSSSTSIAYNNHSSSSLLRHETTNMTTTTTTTDTTTKGDNFLQWHKHALLLVAGLEESDLVYAQFENRVTLMPYCILLDHAKQAIVVSIRGSLSLEDLVTDVHVDPESVEELGKQYGFDATDQYCHAGVVACAQNIYDDIQRRLGMLSTIYPDYQLRLCGHSLGAAICTLMSYMLRPSYPTLHVYNFSPPGCTMTWELATQCESWTTTYVLDSDIVPRLSVSALEDLRDEILQLVGRLKVPKYHVMQSFLLINSQKNNWCGRTAREYEQDLEELNRVISELLDDDDGDGGMVVPNYTNNHNNNDASSHYHHYDYHNHSSTTTTHSSTTRETSLYQRQVAEFLKVQEQRKQSRGTSRQLKLYPPGRMIHLVKTGEIGGCGNAVKKCATCGTSNSGFIYTPVYVANDDLDEIVVTPTMGTDHFIDRMVDELSILAEEEYSSSSTSSSSLNNVAVTTGTNNHNESSSISRDRNIL